MNLCVDVFFQSLDLILLRAEDSCHRLPSRWTKSWMSMKKDPLPLRGLTLAHPAQLPCGERPARSLPHTCPAVLQVEKESRLAI
jgi:hypothetical protein